jgi:RimJ/RimL family protein N-acetyltransferase
MIVPTFKTDRLILRQICEGDADSYQKHFIDYEVIRNLPNIVPWPYPKEGIKEFILTNILPNQGKDQWHWGIFLKENPIEMIGGIELWRDANPDNRGFWLARKFWGQGLMTEAMIPVTNYAFNELKFDKLILSNALGNKASHNIKGKVGAKLIRVESAQYVDPSFTQREIWELHKSVWNRFVSNIK